MGVYSWNKHHTGRMLRERGRPRSADPVLRANNYRDENGRYQVTELKPWHERIVDYMIFNPHAKIVDVATAFGVTPVWVGQLMKTDAFREYYTKRMAEHQGLIGEAIIAKMQGVAVKALDVVAKKLDSPNVDFEMAKDAAALTLKGLGYTSQHRTGVTVNIPSGSSAAVLVDKSIMDRAREKMAAKAAQNMESLEHDKMNYQRVTASLDRGHEDIVDAVVISEDGDS